MCVLLSETILCSASATATNTEVKNEGRFLMKAGFLKKRKATAPVHKTTQAPRLENVNLMQKSETLKNSNKALTKNKSLSAVTQDMSSTDKLALELGNQHTENPNDPAPMDLNIGSGPVWVTGWIKYFKYFPTAATNKLTPQTTPRQYMINPQYNEQFKINPKWNPKAISKDELNDLSTNITDKNKFYSKLLKNQLMILSARDSEEVKSFEEISLKNLDEVVEMAGYPQGKGIENFGNYNNQDFCFRLNQVFPLRQVFIICCADLKTKNNFMGYIKKMKIIIQRDQGIVLIPNIPKGPKTISGMLNPKRQVGVQGSSGDMSNGVVGAKKGQTLTDGFWIILQMWSQCTLKCGGGKSYLQRMCVPPKDGGKPCEGLAILAKDCNKHPCPGVGTAGAAPLTEIKTMKPIVKIMPFSSRPQRYTKCVIKESDMMYTKSMATQDSTSSGPVNKDSKETIQVPVRVIMNNRTVTIFAGEDYETHLDSFNILNSNIVTIDPKTAKGNEASCFYVNSEDGRKAHLCPFGCASNAKVVEEWFYDFNLFKYQCNYGHREQELNLSLEKKLEDKIAKAKQGLMDEAQEDVKKRAQKTEENKLLTQVKKTNSVALQAIQKEINLEDLIKNEEAEREKKEEEEISAKIGAEQDKQKCLIKAIKEKQLENQYNLKQKDTQLAISNIKKAAAQEVTKRRENLKKLIQNMKKKQKRKTNSLAIKLQTVRNAMASDMGKAYKRGSVQNCIIIGNGTEDGIGGSKERVDKRKHYCIANFSENYAMYQTCLDGDDFCHLCCDNEFGEFFLNDRESCYLQSCSADAPPKAVDGSKDSSGRWIWQNHEHTSSS